MGDYSYINILGLVTKTLQPEEGDILDFQRFSIISGENGRTEEFTVRSCDKILCKALRTLKPGECIFIKGYWYFGYIYIISMVRIKDFRSMEAAKKYLASCHMSYHVYIRGTVKDGKIHTHLPKEAGTTGYITDEYIADIDAKDNDANDTYICTVKNKVLIPD